MKKTKLFLIISFICLIFGSLWILTNDINNLLNSCDVNNHIFITHVIRDITMLLRTIAYIVLLIVSFTGLLKNKKMKIVYSITGFLIAFYLLYFLPEWIEYIVSLFTISKYAMTKFLGFNFTIIGVSFLSLYYSNKKQKN